MGRNNRPMKTHPCQYRKEPAGRKRNTATKMTAKRERRMSRVLRLRGVDIGFAVYANDKERVAEAAIQIRRGETRACGRRRGGMNAKRREISLCAGRPFTRVKGKKNSACSARSRKGIRDAKGANDGQEVRAADSIENQT